MELYTERLYLRPVSPSDVDCLFRIYGDPATNLFNPAGPYPDIEYTRTVLARWLSHWDEQGFGNVAITLRDDPLTVIGFGGLSIKTFADITINNLGYRLATQAWGKGLATEFARRILRYGFDDIDVSEISAVVRVNHQDSQNVLNKAGMKCVGTLHDVDSGPPSLLFTLTQDAWRKR